MTENELTYQIIGCAYRVHSALGPGLLENVYEKFLMHELCKSGLRARNQVPIEIMCDDETIDTAFRADVIVENQVIECAQHE